MTYGRLKVTLPRDAIVHKMILSVGDTRLAAYSVDISVKVDKPVVIVTFPLDAVDLEILPETFTKDETKVQALTS